MSGHSKWSTIKHKKGKTDAQRAKIFTKVGREIIVCVKESGADPNNNSHLRELIAKARANNVPSENIDRLIKKAAGDTDKNSYETVIYEGYGPSGVAVMVEGLTDNRNRTAGDVRHYFDKFGGNLGTVGCVSFMFTQKGVIVIEMEDLAEEKLLEDCIGAGALDVQFDEEVCEIYTSPEDFADVRQALEDLGYTFASAQIEQVPNTYTNLTNEDDIVKFERLIDALEDNDDIQEIWHSRG